MTEPRPLRGRISPEEMFPAGDARFRVARLRLASGLSVRSLECGPADGMPIVLFPGWSAAAYLYRFLLPLLADAGFRAIAVEPKGHGLSDKPLDPAEYTTERLVAHVCEIVEALGAPRVVLGGLSMGAALAARAAVPLGGKVRGLILLSPVGTHGFRGLRLTRFVTPRFLRNVYPRLVGRWLVRVILWVAYDRSHKPAPRDIAEYWAPSQFPEFAPAMREYLHELDWGERQPFSLARVRVPALVVYGASDHLVSGKAVVADAERQAHVRVVRFEGVGHVVTDEAPERTAQEIVRFCAALSERAAS